MESKLEDLKQRMLADSRLLDSDLAKSATQLVFGAGNPEAQLMFVGEAPGAQEDKLGQPFVGAAGQFLQDCLGRFQLARADVWITNLVKYRPPNNRDPLPEEKALHAPYLKEEIDLVQPQWIITLGRHAGLHFAPDLRLGQQHGRKVADYQGAQPASVYAFYHPAAALYRSELKEVIEADFARFFSNLSLGI